MKVVALISGGKDSTFNMMHCVANGHEIVAIANLKPAEKDEIDSYMFQTVGHDVIELYAEALGLPLFRRTIIGSSVCTGAVYIEDEQDEVEDLYMLLKEVKDHIDYDAVSSGAILSNYQRIRVENVCRRLTVKSLAYLWQRNQEDLLGEMIKANLNAILIKVAALGLMPKTHLGKTLEEMAPHLHAMKNKFELNVCGEGGEYETITLDCPLFLKKIVIDEQVLVMHADDAFAPVGYLTFKKMHLEDKNIDPTSTLSQRMLDCNLQIPELFKDGMIEYFSKNICTKDESTNDIGLIIKPIESGEQHDTISGPQFYTSNGKAWLTELMCIQDVVCEISLEEATVKTMESLKTILCNKHYNMADISLIHIFCSSMTNFARINSIYRNFFLVNPPARVCVEIPLPTSVVFKMDVCLHKVDTSNRDALHVESISYWAPANIGPYSQVIKSGNETYFSGSIGMDPSSLIVVNNGFEQEATLSLHHVDEVSKVFIPKRKSYKDHGIVVCYITDKSKTEYITELFKCQELFNSSNYLLTIVTVPHLPKDAQVEWHVVCRWEEEVNGDVTIYGDETFKFNINFFKLIISLIDFQNTTYLHDILLQHFHEYSLVLKMTKFMRVYYLHNIDGLNEQNVRDTFHSSFKTAIGKTPAISFVPVTALGNGEIIVVTGSKG